MEMTQKENIMGTQRMSRLILMTGIPLMISLFINSLYNFVDSMFVSRISEDALTALSLAAPVQLLVSSLGLGVCLMFVRTYFQWQSGGNQVIADYGVDYLTVCMLFSFGQMGQWVFDRFVIASGRSGLFLFTLSAASVTNLILDPIFIFGWFGFPRMETLGAAIATVIGQIVGMMAGILMNSILLGFSTTAVAVYGICARIFNICTVGVHGINNGLIPVVAYNYGAGKKGRIREGVKWAMVYGSLFYLVFFGVLELAPAMVLRIFDASEFMLEIGTGALRILALSWFLSIPGLVLSAGLQGLSMGMSSMVITMTRQAILPLAFTMILRMFGNLDILWIGFLAAELAGIPLAVVLWKKRLAKIGRD